MDSGKQKLEFYSNMYKQLQKLEALYYDNFNLDNIKTNILNCPFFKNQNQILDEYNELVALESVILSTLIGLNKEKLEEANSKTKNRNLFQYKNHESYIKIFLNEDHYENGYQISQKICTSLNFNPDKSGPFPYMLEINIDDNKNKPYDYISKIRNALLHSEYYLETSNILHVQNHDEFGSLIFDGKLLLFSFATFVVDFFCINGINSFFPIYLQPDIEKFKSKEDIMDYLKNFVCYKFYVNKIPESYRYKGQDALYSRLNGCFDIDSKEKKSIMDEFAFLEKEGFEFNIIKETLKEEQIHNIYNHILINYKKRTDSNEIINIVSSLVKLQFCPINEITNCLNNMLIYVSIKKDYLIDKVIPNMNTLNELKYDEYCSTSFKYALTLLKLNVINYAIECNEFEAIDFSAIYTNNININNHDEYIRRSEKYKSMGINDNVAENKIIMETIRNSLAHGGDRIKLSIGPELKINLTDTYHNLLPLEVTTNLNTLNKIFSLDIFNPEKIKIKEENKIITKKLPL